MSLCTARRIACAGLLAGLLVNASTIAQSETGANALPKVGRITDDTDMLRRMAEIGGPVGTYEEYLAWDPPRPALFGGHPLWLTPGGVRGGQPMIAILVDSDLRPAIESSLTVYATDLLAEGYSVYIDDVSGGTATEIRDWVRQRYQGGAEGVVLIGGIRVAWFELPNDPFPCDLFYMDVDGAWTDTNGNSVNDTHNPGSGDRGPEVYVARLYTPTLTWNSQENLVNGYLDKTHSYRVGTLTLPRRGLEFIDHDWIYWFYTMGLVYGENVVRWDWGHLVRTDNYLTELAKGYHYVHVAVHSGAGCHFFSNYPTNAVCYAHVHVYSPTDRDAELKLGSCDGIKAWLNGENVLTRDTFQGWEVDQFSANVELEAGWNRLLCKISTFGGPYMFSARFTDTAGNPMPDLMYQTDDPATHRENPYTEHTSHISQWLINGLYENSDHATRLSTDYLGNESGVCPSAGDLAARGRWELAVRDGCPFDLAAYIESVYPPGEQCWSQYIQDVDPQAFFYNLFACSAGRITEANYISAAYILNTSYGLGSVASSRSGSMTGPELFASAFGDGRSFGQAYYDWWNSMEPHYPENIGWWYGLILNGDPTLRRDQPFEDCNQNGTHDPDEVAADPSIDCDENGIPDECDFAAGRAHDCNGNGRMDICDIADGTSLDCNDNDVPDGCDLDAGTSLDCNENGVPDECDLTAGSSPDCNCNDVPDECDIDAGTSDDVNSNGVPDECEFVVCYVNGSAPAGGDGFAWATAYDNLSDALTAAGDNPVIQEIWVTAGTYATSTPFEFVPGVNVYAGFDGTETSRSQRDWQANETILDGSNYAADKVVQMTLYGTGTLLDGFTIQRGECGVYIHGGHPTIANCRITDNVGTMGAGVYIINGATPQFVNCIISGNSGTLGGGVYNGHICDSTFVDCTIIGNVASGFGGGVYNGTTNDLVFVNSTFSDNGAPVGGAIYNEYDNFVACHNCLFYGNGATQAGGAICNNMATIMRLWNCTLTGNSAPEGSSIACLAETVDVACSVSIANSILWDTDSGIWNCNDVSQIVVGYSDIAEGWAGPGNIATDPGFVDAAGNDYRLASGSPCIDAAANAYVCQDAVDLDGDGDRTERLPLDLQRRLRFIDDPQTTDTGMPDPPMYPKVVDMGAYEFGIPCDLDGDCDVDLADLGQLLANYGSTGQIGYDGGDLDGDGDVDLGDLGALLAVYGTTCP